MVWTIDYSPDARKFLRKLDRAVAGRIDRYMNERVAQLDTPRQLGSALQGPLGHLWRYRVGDHRVICSIQDDRLVVLVVEIGDRKDVYR